jgi:hypothetical protein
MVVDSVGTFTLLNGETRRKISLTCNMVGTAYGNDTWVEGMGSLFGVLQSGTCLLVGDNPQLMCFTENDTLKYFNDNFDHCYIMTGIDSHQPATEMVRVFPNPSNGVISFHVNDPLILPIKITLFDQLGKRILEKQLTEPEVNIDLKELTESSFIFYKLTGMNGFAGSGKILIQIF